MAQANTIRTDIVDPYVEVRTDKGTGAGTYIKVGDEILVLTADHVAEGCLEAGEDEEEARTTPARLIRYSKSGKADRITLADVVYRGRKENKKGPDLALLRPRDVTAAPRYAVIPAKIEVELGEDCWYIGTPAGVHARLERSIISGLDADPWHRFCGGTTIRTNGCGWYGNSGGGLYVQREVDGVKVYRLVGVTVAGDPPQGDLRANPKSQLAALDHEAITKFLAGYKKTKDTSGKAEAK